MSQPFLSYPPDPSIARRLAERCRPDEVVTPITPDRLKEGSWWQHRVDRSWPAALSAGLIEPRRGYRFRPENVALAALLEGETARSVVDLGCGTGSLLLIAAVMLAPDALVGIDIQEEPLRRLARTLEAHPIENIKLIQGDLRQPAVIERIVGASAHLADLVVMNPPYFPSGWGRPSKDDSTRLSTHGEAGDIRDFLAAARALLAPGGRIWAVYDASHLATLLAVAGDEGLGLERLVWIADQRPGQGHRPYRVWVALSSSINGSRGARLERL